MRTLFVIPLGALAATLACNDSSSPPPTTTTPKYYAYVTNASDHTVSQFAIRENGTLDPLSPTSVATGNGPSALVADPAGRFVLVRSFNDARVWRHLIQADGTLGQGTSVSAFGEGEYLALHPTGDFVYVASVGGDVHQMLVDPDGAVTPNTPRTVTLAGGSVFGIAVHPSGDYAYAAANHINQFAVAVDGTLDPLAVPTVSSGDPAFAQLIAVTPNGAFAYASVSNGDKVSQFTIDAEGKLNANTPATVAAGDLPVGVQVTGDGKYLFVANQNSATVSRYAIGTDGKLTEQTPAADTTGSPVNLVSHPNGKFLYVANGSANGITQFSIATDGTLDPLTVPTVAAGTFTHSIAIAAK